MTQSQYDWWTTTEDGESSDWGDVIPVRGEVSPDECADYPTAQPPSALDEAEDAGDYDDAYCSKCAHLKAMHYGGHCHGWIESGLCECVEAVDGDFVATDEAEAHNDELYIKAIRAAVGGMSRWVREDVARARRTAAEVFEADNGRTEWQPSAEAKELVRECTR